MLAQGCVLRDKREEADYVVEARAGAIGTDRQEMLFGVPSTSVPAIGAAAPVPTTIPEIPLVKKTEQREVAKIALFAYNRKTGYPVWQSGTAPVESTVRDLWVLGVGPHRHGRIARSKPDADQDAPVPWIQADASDAANRRRLSLNQQAYFIEPRVRRWKLPTTPRRANARRRPACPRLPRRRRARPRFPTISRASLRAFSTA